MTLKVTDNQYGRLF